MNPRGSARSMFFSWATRWHAHVVLTPRTRGVQCMHTSRTHSSPACRWTWARGGRSSLPTAASCSCATCSPACCCRRSASCASRRRCCAWLRVRCSTSGVRSRGRRTSHWGGCRPWEMRSRSSSSRRCRCYPPLPGGAPASPQRHHPLTARPLHRRSDSTTS